MNQERIQTAINRLIQRLKLAIVEDPGSWEVVPSPICILDKESYDLLVGQTGRTGYSEFFTRAVRSIKPIVSIDQLTPVIAAVKKNRSNYRNKTVHTRIAKPESKWIEEMAVAMQVKPARILEAVVFLYLRTEDQGQDS